MNRKQRRHGKPQGTTYSEILARKQKLWSACQQAANDTTVQLQTDIQVQRAMWLMCVAMNDAFGIGPERFQKFAAALQDRTEWFENMTRSTDMEYALEKLRQEAKRCTGQDMDYLFEAEMKAASQRYGGFKSDHI